jgi:hypothetical protein
MPDTGYPQSQRPPPSSTEDRTSPPVRPWVGPLLAGLVVAGAIASLLWVMDEKPSRAVPPPSPKRGVACPDLHRARFHHRSGNEMALREAVDTAARVGELALERSGQIFGRPEEIALELQSVLSRGGGRTNDQVADLLAESQTACALAGY